MLIITGQADSQGKDIVFVSGMVLTAPKVKDFTSKGGNSYEKVELYVRFGYLKDSVCNLDCWMSAARTAKRLDKFDKVGCFATVEPDNYTSTPRFSTGSKDMANEPLFYTKAKDAWDGYDPETQAAVKAKTPKPAPKEQPSDAFTEALNSGDLPF